MLDNAGMLLSERQIDVLDVFDATRLQSEPESLQNVTNIYAAFILRFRCVGRFAPLDAIDSTT